MEFDLDMSLEGVGYEDTVPSFEGIGVEAITEKNIVPKEGTFLGLDISKDSTGVCIYVNGEKTTANISIDGFDKSDIFAEARARMSLQKDLMLLFKSLGVKDFDAAIIEDVFEGMNPSTTRLLYALNTAIDELILTERVTVKEFHRVSNQTWKSWLVEAGNHDELKGLNDKIKVQRVLESLGVSEEGKGFQDRLDATGMVIGYLIHKSLFAGKKEIEKKPNIRVQFSDIMYAFEEDIDLITIQALGDKDGIISKFIDDTKISKKKMIDYLSSDIEAVYITSSPVMLGMLANELDLPLIPGQGGYFGFWLKPKAVQRYRKKLGV